MFSLKQLFLLIKISAVLTGNCMTEKVKWNACICVGRLKGKLNLQRRKTMSKTAVDGNREGANLIPRQDSLSFCVSFGCSLIFSFLSFFLTFFVVVVKLNWQWNAAWISHHSQKTEQCIVKQDTKQKASSESWDHRAGKLIQRSDAAVFPRAESFHRFWYATAPCRSQWSTAQK